MKVSDMMGWMGPHELINELVFPAGPLTPKPKRTRPNKRLRPPTASPASPDWWPKSSRLPSTSPVSERLIPAHSSSPVEPVSTIHARLFSSHLLRRVRRRIAPVGFRFVVVTAAQTAEAAEATLVTPLRACRRPELMDPCGGSPQGELHFQRLKKEHLIGSKGLS